MANEENNFFLRKIAYCEFIVIPCCKLIVLLYNIKNYFRQIEKTLYLAAKYNTHSNVMSNCL